MESCPLLYWLGSSRWRRTQDHHCSSPLLTSILSPRASCKYLRLDLTRSWTEGGHQRTETFRWLFPLCPLWLLLRGVLIEPLNALGNAHVQQPKLVVRLTPLDFHIFQLFFKSFARLLEVIEPLRVFEPAKDHGKMEREPSTRCSQPSLDAVRTGRP